MIWTGDVTILDGTGGWTGDPKKIILTMISSIQLKELEELVYNIDPDAFLHHGVRVSTSKARDFQHARYTK